MLEVRRFVAGDEGERALAARASGMFGQRPTTACSTPDSLSGVSAGLQSDGAPGASDGHDVHRVRVFAVVALALLMMSLDSTIVATALHAIQHGMDTTVNWAGWTITAYSFGFVLMLPISGRLSERFGRRRVFLGSIVVFTVASLLCGLAQNIHVLIALRALQAAGGAGFTPSATGIVVDHFGAQRDRAVSLFGSIFPLGAMIGPTIGGLFVSYWTWRAVFLVNVPIGALLVVLCLRYIPRDRPTAPAERGIDLSGVALLGALLLGLMLALTALGERDAGAGSALFVAPATVAILSAVLFIRHVRRAARPFIAPRLIYGPNFGPVNLITAIFGGITLGAVVLVPLYAINRYGLSALAGGSLLAAEGLAATVATVIGTLVLRRTGYRAPLYIGALITVAGLVMLALHPAAPPAHLWLAIGAFVVGLGTGMTNPASRNAGLQLAPDHSSTIAALRSMSMQIGAITAISVATAVIARDEDPGVAQARLYVIFAVVMLAALPLIARVPEHHGAW